jgi:hypothetical protein
MKMHEIVETNSLEQTRIVESIIKKPLVFLNNQLKLRT